METQRWVNQSQPQTLYIAVFLLYIDAAFAVLLGGVRDIIGLALVAGAVAAGFGIANERKWGYWLGLAIATIGLLFVAQGLMVAGLGLLLNARWVVNAAFLVAKFALLAHPMSRSYYRIWFK